MCALARYVMTDSLNPAFTAGTQWFERTLDDSANKRLSVAEAFLATDAILNIYMNITEGIVVYERVIARRVMEKLMFASGVRSFHNDVRGSLDVVEAEVRSARHVDQNARCTVDGGLQQGAATAAMAACSAFSRPEAMPTPMCARPAFFMMEETSAKSRLMMTRSE